MSLSWSELCTAAQARPLDDLLRDVYAVGAVLVRSTLCPYHRPPSLTARHIQITCQVAAAVALGIAHFRWRRWSDEEKQNGWKLYGWFSALSCLGSAAGAMAYAARIGNLSLNYTSSKIELLAGGATLAQKQLMNTQRGDQRRCAAAFYALFPFELGFVVVSKLMVLHRMHRFAVSRSAHARAWFLCGRLFLAIVIAGNVVGVLGNFVSAAYYSQSADYSSAAAAAWAANNTADGSSYEAQARQRASDADAAASVQRFCEVCVLLIIITAFLVVGSSSALIIASALRTLFTAEQRLVSVSGIGGEQGRQLVALASVQGRWLQRKVCATFVFVFVTVLVRCTFTVMYASAQALQNNGDPCSAIQCDACHNVYSNIQGWILYTPVFQFTVILIASPLALLLALWGMSGVRALEQMANHQVQMDALRHKTGVYGSINHM